jgi:hypothetical protein
MVQLIVAPSISDDGNVACVCSVKKKGEKRKAINRLVLLTIARPEKKEKSFSYALNDDDMTNFFRGGGILLLYVYIQGGHKSRRATGHHLNSLMRQ